jgi:hypothetical protein
MDKEQRIKEACRVIDAFDGTNAMARLCDIKPSSVSLWKTNGLPKAWRKYFSVSRPELFKQ